MSKTTNLALPGWLVAGVQLVNASAGSPEFAPTILCQLRMDAAPGDAPERVAKADLDKAVRPLPGAKVHSEAPRRVGDVAVHEVDVELSANDQRLRQLMWFFSAGGHVFTAIASCLPARYAETRAELERGLTGVVALVCSSVPVQ